MTSGYADDSGCRLGTNFPRRKDPFSTFAGRGGYNSPMGTLFPNDSEYPDHVRVPGITIRVQGQDVAVTMALAGSLLALCPAVEDQHQHVPHEDYRSSVPSGVGISAVSTPGSTGSFAASPGAAALDLSGHAPTIVFGRFRA